MDSEQNISFWFLLAGIGIFLFGIYLMEESIKTLSGRAFKNLIRRYTSSPLKAILSGTLSTAILQSSSAVTLMVLAFAGAGIMQMSSAIGVVIGSNLGTTLTSWIVASIGFKLDISALALPVVGIGGLALIFLGSNEKSAAVSKLMVGFGFLFMGLDYMKTSIEGAVDQIDFTVYADYSMIAFVGMGFLLTALVQSSSAAMAIVLSLVFSELVHFDKAAAMVIGTNIGTTVKVMLGSIGGPKIKQRIGVSHLLFNFLTGILAIVLLPLLIMLLELIYPIYSDPVIGLAIFHSVFNLLGVIAFAPFLRPFAALVEKILPEEEKKDFQILQAVTSNVPEAGLVSLQEMYEGLLLQVFDFNLKIVNIDSKLILPKETVFYKSTAAKSHLKYYNDIKTLQNEIITFSASISSQSLTEEESNKLHKLIHSIRFASASAKSMKDGLEYLELAMDSDHQLIKDHINTVRRFIMKLYQELSEILIEINESNLIHLINWRQKVINTDKKWMSFVSKAISSQQLSQEEIDILLSLNRSVILSCRQIISSLRDAILSEKEIEIFEET